MDPRRKRSDPMPVKYWSSAGLMLTYWCNARCASCYLNCSPERDQWMPIEYAIDIWRGLISACPHGCRVHLTGGEPFGNFDQLLALCTQARDAGLGPLAKIETNAFWAEDPQEVRNRLMALEAVGLEKLTISADPYHQQFVPIVRARLAAKIARQVLGPKRVQIRWRDWLDAGSDTGQLSDIARDELFRKYAADNRDRYNGRASEALANLTQGKSVSEFADNCCKEALLRSKHVHIGPDQIIMPGTCAGIILGRASSSQDIARTWQKLDENWSNRPIIGTLASEGPVGLARKAEASGFILRKRYASKCHLCWEVRKFLLEKGQGSEELGPSWMYAR